MILSIAVVLLILPLSESLCIPALFLAGCGVGPLFPNMMHLTGKHFAPDIALSNSGIQMTFTYTGILIMPADDRAASFVKLCKESGVEHTVVRYPSTIYNTMDYVAFIRELLAENPGIDGIFASSDLIACQVSNVCHQLGIRIPQDLKLVGFDDVLMSQLATPSITTIHQPLEEMAEKAISIIHAACNDQSFDLETVFPVMLIRRDSV